MPGQIPRCWRFWLALLCLAAANGMSSFAGFKPNGEVPVPPLEAPRTIGFSNVKTTPEVEPAGDLLVLKTLELMPGKLISASSSGPLRWKPATGKELDIQADRIAGIRLTARRPEAAKSEATVQLRNGDRLSGEIMALDQKQIVLKHPQLGAITMDRSRIFQLHPNRRLDLIEGGSEAATPFLAANTNNLPFPGGAGKPISWIYLDGAYSQKIEAPGAPPRNTQALHWAIPEGLDPFEVRFELTGSGNVQPSFIFMLKGDANAAAVQISFSYPNVQIMQQTAAVRANQRRLWKAVSLKNKVPTVPSRMSIRIVANARTGIMDIYVNGVAAVKIGQQLSERLPGLGRTMLLGGFPNSSNSLVISNVRIDSWNGEIPLSESVAATTFTNNDVTSGAVSGFRDGKFAIESEIGMLQVPRENVKVIEFGGTMTSEQAKAKIRLADGSAISVDTFKWTGGELIAHSAILGDLRLPAEMVAELIYNPAPLHLPPVPAMKTPSQEINGSPLP
ncbi:MAG: hypothetical protein JWL90_813 [Chthoniobacteraceae bacterium]|nr:hypothetical protein [Chthoniobacteraceae bacterium]